MSGSVPTAEALDCLRQILAEHRRHKDEVREGLVDEPLLLAVAVDERERLQDLIEHAFRADLGLVVDATAVQDSADFDSDPGEIAALAAAVEEALDEVNALPGATESLRLDLGSTLASIGGVKPFASASKGQQALRSILASLFLLDLRANDLAGFVYPEEALDRDHRSVVWRLLMRLPQLLNRPPASTTVVFAGDADIDFDVHCSGDPSLRWRLTDGGLKTRHPRTQDEDAVRVLARLGAADAPLVMMMLGAGASAGYLPLGNQVRDRALGLQVGMQVDGHNYAQAAGKFYVKLARSNSPSDRLLPEERSAGSSEFIERLTLERVLREEQHEENTAFSDTLRWFSDEHKAVVVRLEAERATGALADDPLARLIGLRRRLVLVTVNFDKIIETKCGADVRPFVTESELENLPDYLDEYARDGGPVPLIKAHGDIEQPDTIVADINTTRGGLAQPVYQALLALRERLLAQNVSPLWHVGYSMRDIDLEEYWSSVEFPEKAMERWVSPMPDPAVERFIHRKRVPVWARSHDPQTPEECLVSLTAADFFTCLYDSASRSWLAK